MRVILFAASILLIASTGCQREVDDTLVDPVTPPSTSTTAKIKQIRIQDNSPSDPYDETVLIQYDTPGRKINFYFDNPATPGLFDVQDASYEFNEDGYLIKLSEVDGDDQLKPNVVLHQNSANELTFIEDFNVVMSPTPPVTVSYFSYTHAGSQMIVKDSTKRDGTS